MRTVKDQQDKTLRVKKGFTRKAGWKLFRCKRNFETSGIYGEKVGKKHLMNFLVIKFSRVIMAFSEPPLQVRRYTMETT